MAPRISANGSVKTLTEALRTVRKDAADDVFHTYSSYARGPEPLLGVYYYLDLVPKGRDEDAFPFPMAWVRHHDRYNAERHS